MTEHANQPQHIGMPVNAALELWTMDRLLTAARTTIHVLRHSGVPITNQSRLARAYRYLRQIEKDEAKPEGATIDLLQYSEAVRTVFEQFFIVRATRRDEAPALDALRTIQKGADTPTDDANSKARNTQFEMFVAALLRLGGVRDVRFGEPDIRIAAGPKIFGVAAKRLASISQLDKRVSKAAEQIRRSADAGVVVLNFDRCVEHLLPDAAGKAVTELTNQSCEIIEDAEALDVVFGVIGFSTVLHHVRRDAHVDFLISAMVHTHLFAPDAARERVEGKVRAIGRNIVNALVREALTLGGDGTASSGFTLNEPI